MNMLECRSLTKRYGSMTALDGIDLTLESGRIVGLLGPNGSGKTTMIKLANGLLKPSNGEILICGMRPGAETRQLISYMPDKEYLPDWMKTGQLLNFFGEFYQDFDKERAARMLADLAIPSNKSIKKMSKGTKEKVQLILTMSRRAKIYLLDEPIAGVDPAARDYILHTIMTNYEKDALVMISTHLIADVEEVLDEAVFIRNGQIVLHKNVNEIREESGTSVDGYFREVFRC